jgi:hypothetical protein
MRSEHTPRAEVDEGHFTGIIVLTPAQRGGRDLLAGAEFSPSTLRGGEPDRRRSDERARRLPPYRGPIRPVD